MADDCPGELKVCSSQTAGKAFLMLLKTCVEGEALDLKVTSGHAVRISTGAAIPNGADSVVQVCFHKLDGPLDLFRLKTPNLCQKRIAVRNASFES